MAVTQPSASTSYGTTGGDDSRSVTVDASANLLLVRLFSRINPGAWTVSFNSVALTALTGTLNSGTVIYGEWFYLANPSTGAHTMAIVDPNFHPWVAEVYGLAGANTSTPFHSQGGNNWATSSANPGNTPSITLTSASGELCLDGVGHEDLSDVALTVSGGTGSLSMTPVRQDDGASGSALRVGGSTAAGSGSTTMSWSIAGSKTYLQIGVAIQASGAAPASQPQMMMMGAG